MASRKRALTQKIEFVFVEAALEAEQQAVVAMSRCVNRLLIDQYGIDDTAHLDQLLPVAAVAGEARDFPRCDGADLAEADLGHHPLEAGASDAARRRTP